MRPTTQGAAIVSYCPWLRSATRLVLVAGILACLTGPSAALVPGDLCTGDPCVIASDFVVDASVVLDFGSTTALQFAPGIKVLIKNGATLDFEAGSITIGSGAKFSSDAPGSALYFSANATNIDAGNGSSPVKLLLRDSIEVGFSCEADCTVNAKADVSGETGEGGVVFVESLGKTTFTGKVVADGSKDGQFNAGVIDLEADGSLQVDAKLRAKGYGPDSGQVMMRGAAVDVGGGIDVKPKVGGGGIVQMTAQAGDIASHAKIDAGGKRASDDTGGNNCNGGSVDMTATGQITLSKKVSVRGGGPGGCAGGTFSAQAGTNFLQLSSAPIQATTPGFISFGGSVQIQAAGNITLEKIDVGSDNAGHITATAGGLLDAAGQLKAGSNGSGDAVDGSISLTGACGLNVPDGAGVKAAQSSSSGGVISLVTSGGPMTIAGNVEASSAVNVQYVTGFTPVITGNVTPAPTLTEVPTGTCGT